MSKIYLENFHYQPRRDTAAQWQANNPVLCDGEIGIVTDGTTTEWLKVGDGTTPWNQLPYKKGPKGEKGDTGAQGEKGDKGEKGERGFPAVTDQTYSPTSQNAQSGRAVATAIANKADTSVMSNLEGRISSLGGTINALTSEIYSQGGIKEKADSALQSDDIDQTYSPTSENAQSGKAVAEAAVAEEQRSNNAFANALKGSVSGSAVRMDDTSPVEHTIGVKAKSKNTLNPALWTTASSNKGLTIQYLPDEDCFVANGTITPTSSETSADIGIKSVNIPINKGKNYTLSVKYISGESEMPNLHFVCRDALGSSGSQVIKINPLLDKQNHTTTAVINATAIKDVRFYFYMGGTTPKTVTNYKFRIQLEESDAATPYTPYVPDLTATKVMKYGENVADIYGFSANVMRSATAALALTNEHGTTISTINPADTLTVTQTKWNTGYDAGNFRNGYFCIGLGGLREGVRYTFSCNIEVTDNHLSADTTMFPTTGVNEYVTNDFKQRANGRYAIAFTYKPGSTYRELEIRNKGCSLIISNMKLEVGYSNNIADTVYTPPIASTEYTPAADGTVEGVKSLYPTTSLIPDIKGLTLEADYNRDINKAFAELQQAIISLSGAEIQSAIEAQYPTEVTEATEEAETTAE